MEKEMKIVVSKTGKQARIPIAKGLGKIVKVKQKFLKKVTRAEQTNEGAVLVLRGKFRVAIKWFKPRQTKKGITVKPYKMASRANAARQYDRGFMGPRPGVPTATLRGQAVYRTTAARSPIAAIPAVVPVADLKEHPGLLEGIVQDVSGELANQIRLRIRYLTRKAAGTLRGKQPN
jgi:hypothetical protein